MSDLSEVFEPGRRRGIVFILDLGAALISTDAINPTWNVDEYKISNSGSGCVIGLGYAPLDQIVVLGTLRSAYYGENAGWAWGLGPLGGLVADYHVMALVGAKFYFVREAPSWFMEFGYGVGAMSNPLDDDMLDGGDRSGSGSFAGIGYEFAHHLQFEVGVMRTRDDKDAARINRLWKSTTVMATVGVMAY
ncbi:MAG: hypothetical protein ABIK83_07240 [Candidatus Zixiibacteriota bacterium]